MTRSRSTHPRPDAAVERLERRRLASAVSTNVNLTALTAQASTSPSVAAAGNQTAAAIAFDPASPTHVFAVANLDPGAGLLVATSADGGASWSTQVIADSTPTSTQIPRAFGQADATFDAAGNLFLAYVNAARNRVVVLSSADAGTTFGLAGLFPGQVANPKLAAGGANIWLAYDRNGAIATASAANSGSSVGPFVPAYRPIPRSAGARLEDLAAEPLGPAAGGASTAAGYAAVAFAKPIGPSRAELYVSIALSTPPTAAPQFDPPTAVVNLRLPRVPGITTRAGQALDGVAHLAYDNAGGSASGETLYLAYVNATSSGTTINLRDASAGHQNWSESTTLVASTGSVFLPQLTADLSAGAPGGLVLAWYDTSQDLGTGGPTDTDGVAHDDAEYALARLTPTQTGVQVGATRWVSAAPSNLRDAQSARGYGDAIALFSGTVLPLWSDNSNSTIDNPSGTLRNFNLYTAAPISFNTLPTTT